MTGGSNGAVRMPAEWEPHAATWLAYPHLARDWPGKLSAVRWAFVELLRKLLDHEAVQLLVRDASEAKRASSAMRRGGVNLERLDIHVCPTDRAWLKDSGPTFVLRDDALEAVCWGFNAWGRYANWHRDARVGRFIGRRAGARIAEAAFAGRPVTMEGGAIDGNGCGTVMTTEECLLGQGRYARNPGMSKAEVETVLKDTLGASTVLWLGRGIAGDDTSGHIDNIARFVGPKTIAVAIERDRRDENFEALQDNLARLRGVRDQDGHRFDVVELPMPRPLFFDGDRIPASYANFYVGNGCVLVPTFNDPSDRVALRTLENCFPGREVCGIHCLDLAVGQGTLHCLAQSQPLTSGR